ATSCRSRLGKQEYLGQIAEDSCSRIPRSVRGTWVPCLRCIPLEIAKFAGFRLVRGFGLRFVSAPASARGTCQPERPTGEGSAWQIRSCRILKAGKVGTVERSAQCSCRKRNNRRAARFRSRPE